MYNLMKKGSVYMEVQSIDHEYKNDDWDEVEWLKAIAQNPAFDFLHNPEEDIYTIHDGKPLSEA